MKNKKDVRFWLGSFVNNEVRQHLYKEFKDEIERIGYYSVKSGKDEIKVYSPELALIFYSDALPVRNMDTQEDTTVNGLEYVNTYITAYKEGEKKFDTDFAISPNILYGANLDQYVKDIQYNYFQAEISGFGRGWHFVKNQDPTILTHKIIHDFGYYSGLVNSVEKIIEKYPTPFESLRIRKGSKTKSYCTSKEFKTDISQLCDDCPIKSEINKYLKPQVEIPTIVKKEIFTETQFNEYLESQITAASEAMDNMTIQELRSEGNLNDKHRKNRIKGYIWNKERIKLLNTFQQNEVFPPQQTNLKKTEFSLPQIALKYIYEGSQITRDNGKEIARQYGYTSNNSGEKLYQKFIKYCNASDRKGDEGTKRRNKYKIKLLESVIELLPPDKQNRAKDEVSILKSINETQYE